MTATQTPLWREVFDPSQGQALGTPEAGAGSMTEASCRKPWYAYREAGTGNAASIHTHLPQMQLSGCRDDADRCLPVLL